jgi:hypothetical protein
MPVARVSLRLGPPYARPVRAAARPLVVTWDIVGGTLRIFHSGTTIDDAEWRIEDGVLQVRQT